MKKNILQAKKLKKDFDANGDVARVWGTNGTTNQVYANSFNYTASGGISAMRLGNGKWETAKFNDRLQVTEFGLGRGAENMNLWKLNLEYGELNNDGTVDKSKNTGNLAKQTISFDGLAQPFVQTYKYDSLYRITEAKETNNGNQTWIQNFGYDRYGNRTTLSQNILGQQLAINKFTHPTIDPNTNRFDAGQDYTYDKVGNLIGDADNRSFTFDGNNKQILVTNLNSQTVGEYFYDGNGKRVKKKSYEGGVLDETVIFVYSGGKLVEEFSTKAPPTEPQTKYVATDHLQSIRALSNQDGEIVSRRDFMPFGEELQADTSYRQSNLKYNSDDVRQKFTGYEKDEETGLDYAQARMYQNQHARFTAVDPLLASGKSGNPQTFNRYVYVANSPLQYTDPDGLQIASDPVVLYIYTAINRFGEMLNDIYGAGSTGSSNVCYNGSCTRRYTESQVRAYNTVANSDRLQNANNSRFQARINRTRGDREADEQLTRGLIGRRGANLDNVLQQTTDAYKRAKTVADVGFTLSNGVLSGASLVRGTQTVTTNLGTSVSRGTIPSGGFKLYATKDAQIRADVAQQAFLDNPTKTGNRAVITGAADLKSTFSAALPSGPPQTSFGSGMLNRLRGNIPGTKGRQSFYACCSEFRTSNFLERRAGRGGSTFRIRPENLIFSRPVRVNGGEPANVCKDCSFMFRSNQFPVGTYFDRDQ